MKTILWFVTITIILFVAAFLLRQNQRGQIEPVVDLEAPTMVVVESLSPFMETATDSTPTKVPTFTEVQFTLQTAAENGKLIYRGIGGEIDGMINPDLIVHPGDVVRVILVNGDAMPHDLFFPDFNVKTSHVSRIGEKTEVGFEVGEVQTKTYAYYCTVPGHRQAGQEGKLIVAEK